MTEWIAALLLLAGSLLMLLAALAVSPLGYFLIGPLNSLTARAAGALRLPGVGAVALAAIEDAVLDDCEVVFSCLPHGVTPDTSPATATKC